MVLFINRVMTVDWPANQRRHFENYLQFASFAWIGISRQSTSQYSIRHFWFAYWQFGLWKSGIYTVVFLWGWFWADRSNDPWYSLLRKYFIEPVDYLLELMKCISDRGTDLMHSVAAEYLNSGTCEERSGACTIIGQLNQAKLKGILYSAPGGVVEFIIWTYSYSSNDRKNHIFGLAWPESTRQKMCDVRQVKKFLSWPGLTMY